MSKREFLLKLRKRLYGLTKDEIRERLDFYEEIIDDRIEEGLSEEEAVLAVGPIDAIAEQILSESSGDKKFKAEKGNARKLRTWEIVLLALGSPIWVSILISIFAVIISVYAVIWSLVIVIWALELPFFIFSYISKFLLIVCRRLTEGTFLITKYGAAVIKKLFGINY